MSTATFLFADRTDRRGQAVLDGPALARVVGGTEDVDRIRTWQKSRGRLIDLQPGDLRPVDHPQQRDVGQLTIKIAAAHVGMTSREPDPFDGGPGRSLAFVQSVGTNSSRYSSIASACAPCLMIREGEVS